LDSGFGLEVNPRNHLRNGHLHNMKLFSGCPDKNLTVMA
jgi:hypothetical protein